jgi:hypothetical protein
VKAPQARKGTKRYKEGVIDPIPGQEKTRKQKTNYPELKRGSRDAGKWIGNKGINGWGRPSGWG